MNERFNPKTGAAAITSLPRSLEHLLDQIWPFLNFEADAGQAVEIEPDDNLLELGLDSLKVMELAGRWRKLGAKVSFAKLISTPTAAQWLALCQELKKAPNAAVETDTIAAEPAEDATPDQPFELSDVQYAYWVGRRDDQVMGGNGCHAYLELDGQDVEPQRLQIAWSQLLERHDMLRAQFHEDGTQTIQAAAEEFTLSVHDLRALSGAACANRLEEIRARLDHRRLEIACGQVAGLELSLLPEGATRLHFDIDLLVADVHSLSIVLRDLALLYSGDDLPDLSRHRGFRQALARRKVEQESQRTVDCAYWDAAFADGVEQPKIPLAVTPGSIEKPFFSRRKHLLRPEQWAALKSNSARHQVTPAMVLAKTFSLVLARWSGQEGFVLNLPLFSRDTAEEGSQHVVGDFTDLLLLRTEVDVEAKTPPGQMSFAQGVRDLQARFHQDMQHSAYSAVQIQRDLAAKYGQSSMRAPVVFASNLGTPLVDDHCSATLGTLGHMISQTPGVWLDHQIYEEQESLSLCWDVVEALFPAGVIDGMFSAYVGLLDLLCGDGAQWDTAVALDLPATQDAVRVAVNQPDQVAAVGRSAGAALHGEFFAQAAAHPDRLALIDCDKDCSRLSYGTLAQQALRIAATLRARGLRSGDLVAVSLPRGADQVAAVLGILAAGGAYVPIDLSQPAARRHDILTLSGAALALIPDPQTAQGELCHPEGVTPLPISEALAADPLAQPIWPEAPLDQALAYVIFTSGSTGVPKGVELSHAAAENTIADINQRFDVRAEDRVLAVSALDFDLSVYDIFGLLAVGGALVLVSEADRREAPRWHHHIAEHGVTLWNSAPALMEMLLAARPLDNPGPGGLRLAMLSGDWIGLELPATLRRWCPDCRFVAMGGATEAAIWSNYQEVGEVPQEWSSIPYGRPLSGQCYRVVDPQGRDCPDWVAGELWIGGRGVALGYRGAPALTAERFVTAGGQRWYRTGDLGRYWPDGRLEFLGRRDHQVKIRGHRIELGEVERALESHPAVSQAVVLATGLRGRMRLVGFGCAPDGSPNSESLRAHLAELLPGHAVPEVILALPQLPLTASGKIDRKALAPLADGALPEASSYEPPQGEIETAIAQIWQDLLGIDNISRSQSFLEAGGDSLVATEMVKMVGGALGVELSLRQIFSEPTIAGLGGVVTETLAQSSADTMEEGSL